VGKIDKIELENHHIAEEMVEHLILEKIGALPDHGHSDKIPLNKKIKKPTKSNNSLFFIISFLIITGELWYIGNHLFSEYPNLKNLF